MLDNPQEWAAETHDRRVPAMGAPTGCGGPPGDRCQKNQVGISGVRIAAEGVPKRECTRSSRLEGG